MRSKSLIFMTLASIAATALAEQSPLETLGGKAAQEAVKSATPDAAAEGAKAIGKAKDLKDAAKAAPADLKGQALEAGKKSVQEAVPTNTVKEGAKTLKEGADGAKAAGKTVEQAPEEAAKAVKSAKGKAKKKAVDSALEMMH